MKQVLQSYRTGERSLVDVPAPTVRRGRVVVQTAASVISPGTERMVSALAEASLVGMALARPDQAKKVLEKVRRDGVISTLAAVKGRLADPVTLGYSAAGTVVAVGDSDAPFQPGDRVACTGAGWASHAEVVTVPYALCAKVPSSVDDAAAALAGIAAMAMHGVRQGGVALGDHVAIIGLGLLGQIATRLCLAAGARVVGIDPVAARVELARAAGADGFERSAHELPARVRELTGGHGVDSVLIYAATSDSDPVELAADLARDRGTVVSIGATGLSVPRRPFYDKELRLEMSRSTGPGRYDPTFEIDGVPYPRGHVPWTQTRNLEAWLALVADRRVDPSPLLTERWPFRQGLGAWDALDAAPERLAAVLEYGDGHESLERTVPTAAARSRRAADGVLPVVLVGAGRYASDVLGPALQATSGLRVETVVSDRGVSASTLARRLDAATATTDLEQALARDRRHLVVVATPHHLHAEQAVAALAAGHDVFVEKPLAIDEAGLDDVLAARRNAPDALLAVGFNRRWSPLVRALKRHWSDMPQTPWTIHVSIAAGRVADDHWIADRARSGGRLVGELCHWVDLVCFLRDAVVSDVHARCVGGGGAALDDRVALSLALSDGSVATLTYTAANASQVSKERIEVHGAGRSAVLVDHRQLTTWRDDGRAHRQRQRQDKGQRAMIDALVSALHAGSAAQAGFQALHQLESVGRACLEARAQLRTARLTNEFE